MAQRTTLWLAAVAALAAAPSLAVIGGPTDLFQSLKEGQWVELEGTPQRDRSALCTEAKILTGDLLEDDWSVTGIVRSVDLQKRVVVVHTLPIRMRERVELDSPNGRLNDFRPGMLISADGTYMKDGSFLAKELEDETQKLERKPQYHTRIQFVGRIEKLNSARQTVTLMGTTFVVNDRTRVKSVVK